MSHMKSSRDVVDTHMWHDSLVLSTLIYDMTHSSRWHSYMTGLVHLVDTHMWHNSSCWQICLTWHIYMWRDASISLTLIYDWARPSCWHTYVTWLIVLINIFDMTHIYVTWCIHLVDTHIWLGSFILLTHICDMNHRVDKYIWYDTYICAMMHSSRWHSCMTGLVHRVDTHMWHNSSCWQFFLTWLVYMWHDVFISWTLMYH